MTLDSRLSTNTFWQAKRVMVTGGAGFLGSYVVKKLRQRGCEHIFIPRSKDYDLREKEAIVQMYEDSRPDIVIHLAAVVGGIGANQKYPGKFFYDNAIMGIQLIEQARQAGIEKFVCLGTICAYPKYTPVSSSAWVPSVPIQSIHPCRSMRITFGTATLKRPMPLMAWQRRCFWCSCKPTASSMGSMVSTCCLSICMVQEIISTQSILTSFQRSLGSWLTLEIVEMRRSWPGELGA